MRKIYLEKSLLLCVSIFLLVTALNGQISICQNSKQLKSQAPIYPNVENKRSDTFNILKYNINLEIGSNTGPLINGYTSVRFVPKLNNLSFIRLDLLKLSIDSVKENNLLLNYSYNDTIVKINFSSLKNSSDTSLITVYYKGQPKIDGTGWGGFYFDNTQSAQYAFNLGVGFGANPHNYGRVWFPCFDNFVERSTYEFHITSDSSRRAYCNGQLVSDITNGSKRTRTWVLNEEIPTYLASVALAKYAQVNWTVNTLTGVKPITLAAHASDTTAMKAGFVNLKNCINAFENYFGPYLWIRFGYCLVPFNGGAMEHATNIAYPRFAAGNLNYEADLMAHELAHHWWGNLITCETPEDMWINEGFAVFSAYMFTEWQYGKTAYLNKVKPAHDKLLHLTHKKESGFRAVSGLPHQFTYGEHVYTKGADVAHTLRSYMGDAAFFAASKYVMSQNQFKSINSIEFRDLLQTSSGQNLSDFFNNWVLAGGWPHFSVDSVRYIPLSNSGADAIVHIKQKLFGAPNLYNNVPLELSFFKKGWNTVVKQIVFSGSSAGFTLSLPFMPEYCALNFDSKISDASSHEVKIIKANGTVNFNLGKLNLIVSDKGADSSLVRVIHNYVKPDPFKINPSGHKLSNQHYWKIEGLLAQGFTAKARFNYDGNKSLSGTYAYMDTLLTIINADSIALFYRENSGSDWVWLKNTNKMKIGLRTGYIETDSIKAGEYTFGNLGDTSSVGLTEQLNPGKHIKVFPNPARGNLAVELNKTNEKEHLLYILNAEGKIVLKQTLNAKKTNIDIRSLNPAAYFVEVRTNGTTVFSQKLLIE